MSHPKRPNSCKYNNNVERDILYNYASLDSLSSLYSSINPNINLYTINLENNGKLLRPKSDYNKDFRKIFEKYGSSICCCVVSNTRTIPYYNFESTHFIYFQYKRHKLKKNKFINKSGFQAFQPNDYQTQKRFSYYFLPITYYQLLSIDKLIKQLNTNNKLFAEPFPQALQDTIRKRGQYLHSKYEYEEWLMTRPLLPDGPCRSIGGIFGKKKSMTSKDLLKYSKYLHKILNNAQLLLNDELYEILNINDAELITLFKVLALSKLKALLLQSNKYLHEECLRDPTKLQRKYGINFHTLWIVKRPLNDRNAAFLGCDHWALKFEGNNQLMTIGFFSYNEQHGIILSNIVPNTPLNRRLFWYYWPRADNEEIECHHLNTGWTVLERLYLGEISCELIGILIVEWLKYDNHAIYELTHNNCQHFVRDFVAPLNIKIAKRLSSSFDVKVVKSLIPAANIAEGIDAEAKCNNLYKRFWPILSKYQSDMKLKKEKEKQMNPQQILQNNFDFIRQQLNLSSSEDEQDQKEEEKEESKQDMHDSLTIYKTHIDINRHGNECYDDDDMKINKNENNHKMNLSVTPSFTSLENNDKDKDNGIK